MKKTTTRLFGHAHAPVFLLLSAIAAGPALGETVAPNLASAASFALLGGTISNTGSGLFIGDVGATTTVTGFPPGTATGMVYPAPSDPNVTQAYNDFVNAYNLALLDPSTASFSGLTTSQVFLGNNVYTSALTDVVSTDAIDLTFNAQGDSTEVFVIEIARDLTINGPITFDLENGALASNIFWIVGRAETIDPVGAPVTWDGDILAETSSIGPGSALAGVVNGCVFAETANTLTGDTNVNGCGLVAGTVPEPGSVWLAAIGFLFGAWRVRRRPNTVT